MPHIVAALQESQRCPARELTFLKTWAQGPAMGWLTRPASTCRSSKQEHRVQETKASLPITGLQLGSGPTSPGRPEPPKQPRRKRQAAATAGADRRDAQDLAECMDLGMAEKIVADLERRGDFFGICRIAQLCNHKLAETIRPI